VGGDDYYVKERPNLAALTHTEIFERLVRDGIGVSGVGTTEPLLANGELLYDALQELAGMVGSLEVGYQAGSTMLAVRAIDRVGSHVHSLAAQVSQVANGFNGYIEAYQEARNRVPPPLPFAEQLDAIQEHSPDLLARLPILAQLEEEHAARTQEAREVYRRLDQAAVAADAATPAFPLMFESVTNDKVDTGSSARRRLQRAGQMPPAMSPPPRLAAPSDRPAVLRLRRHRLCHRQQLAASRLYQRLTLAAVPAERQGRRYRRCRRPLMAEAARVPAVCRPAWRVASGADSGQTEAIVRPMTGIELVVQVSAVEAAVVRLAAIAAGELVAWTHHR
jgi:hypothetical protein